MSRLLSPDSHNSLSHDPGTIHKPSAFLIRQADPTAHVPAEDAIFFVR